jgi:hypothetical protein
VHFFNVQQKISSYVLLAGELAAPEVAFHLHSTKAFANFIAVSSQIFSEDPGSWKSNSRGNSKDMP